MSTSRRRVRDRAEPLAIIGAGGFLGAVVRFWLARGLPATFPWGTLVANVVGAFLLGILLFEAHLAGAVSVRTRLLIGTGFCSSLTTYSTFAVETAHLDPAVAAVNVGVTYAFGFGAIVLGQLVARWVS